MMNITVIPFLLEVLVPDNNRTKWNLDVEYIFKLDKTTAFIDNFENVTATIICRPSIDMFLVCAAYKMIVSKLMQGTSGNIMDVMKNKGDDENLSFYIERKKIPDRSFTLQFYMRGVQNYQVTWIDLESHVYDLIPDIVEQFHMGIDLSTERNSMKNYENKTSGIYIINSLTQTNEETIKASKCNTTLIIMYTPSSHFHKDGDGDDKDYKINSDFFLKLQPISYMNPTNKTFSIERKRVACIDQPENIQYFNQLWEINNITEYYNVIKLRNKKFSSQTHLEGYVLSQQKHILHFREDVHLRLYRIKLNT